jgi:hypothetical protein
MSEWPLSAEQEAAAAAMAPHEGNSRPRRRRYDPPPAWQPFPTDALPERVREYVRAGSHAMKCDEAFIALPMLAGLAGAIGATRRITVKPGWHEPCVVWAAVVGDSGTMKSPAQALALQPLRRAQEWQLEELAELEEQFVRDKALYDADYQAWKRKGRTKGEPPPEKPQEPQVARYLVNDITVEALAEILSLNPRGVLAACDELTAWLGAFDQYRAGRGSDCPKWLSIHRAENIIIDRKTGAKKTVFVKRAAVSVVGSVQPKTLSRALGDEYFQNGLAARLLFACPPRVAKQWTEASVDRDTYKNVERIYARLLALDFGLDENEKPAPVDVPMTVEAKAAWVKFYEEHAAAMAETHGKMAAAMAKLEAYAARLALIIYFTKMVTDENWAVSKDHQIDVESMVSGITLTKWFTHEVGRVYRILEETEEEAEGRHLVEWIGRQGGAVTVRDLARGPRRYRDSETAEMALRSLVEAGLGEWEHRPPGRTGGPPFRMFKLTGDTRRR